MLPLKSKVITKQCKGERDLVRIASSPKTTTIKHQQQSQGVKRMI